MRTDDLIRDLAATPPRVDPLGIEGRLAAALTLGLGVAGLAVALALGVRGDLAALALTGAGALKFAGGVALALAGWRIAGRLARPGTAALTLLPCALIGLTAVLAAATGWGGPGAGWPGGLASVPDCAGVILLLAAPVLLVALAALRRGAPTRPGAAGAAAGLAAGAVAALAYALWCPANDAAFVVLAYGAALAVSTAAGALAGRLVLVW